MSFDDRLGWLLIGCVIGFFMGYVTRSLRDIKDELHEVDSMVKNKTDRPHDETGFTRYPIIMDIALLIVIVLTVWAAFASQKASNDVQENQDQIARLTVCHQKYLSKTIAALNERTTYTREQVRANIKLQESQAAMLTVLVHKPPYPRPERVEATKNYLDALTRFVTVNGKSSAKVEANPFPDNNDLASCYESDGKKGLN